MFGVGGDRGGQTNTVVVHMCGTTMNQKRSRGVQKVMTAAALDENTTLVASGKQTTCGGGGVESQGIRSGGGTRVGCEGKAKIKWAGERYF